MNFVADEGIDGPIVEVLRENKHYVWYVAEMDPGISDEEVLSLANRENALLLTQDKDFGDLVFRQNRSSPGVILIRMAGLPPSTKATLVLKSIVQHQSELLQAFTVITPDNIRIRPKRS